MKIRSGSIILIFLLSLSFLPVFVQAEDDLRSSRKPFKVYINFERLSFEESEPVMLYISIKNNSNVNQSFKIFDVEYTTFRPVVYDMDGREPETLVEHRLKGLKSEEILGDRKPRVIELSGNDIFSYTVDLKTLYNIEPEREYRVKALFYPDALTSEPVICENQLNFMIMQYSGIDSSGIARIRRYISPERELSPSEVVLLFLKAEKDRNWDNYFKYIDIESYINAYPDYVRVYNEAVRNNDLEKKERIILEFVDFLKKERSDYIISYKILNELMRTRDNYYVEALVNRFGAVDPFTYRYKYSLEKFENFWIIKDLEATVVKRQKI